MVGAVALLLATSGMALAAIPDVSGPVPVVRAMARAHFHSRCACWFSRTEQPFLSRRAIRLASALGAYTDALHGPTFDADTVTGRQDGVVKSFSASVVAVSGDRATVRLQLIYTDTYGPSTAWFHLIREGGRWKIDDIAYGPKDGEDSFARFAVKELAVPLPARITNDDASNLVGWNAFAGEDHPERDIVLELHGGGYAAVGCEGGSAFVRVSQGYVTFEDHRNYPVSFVAGNARFDFTLVAKRQPHARPDDKIFEIKAAIPAGALNQFSRAMLATARTGGSIHVQSREAGVDFTLPPDGFPQTQAWLRKYATASCPIGP